MAGVNTGKKELEAFAKTRSIYKSLQAIVIIFKSNNCNIEYRRIAQERGAYSLMTTDGIGMGGGSGVQDAHPTHMVIFTLFLAL